MIQRSDVACLDNLRVDRACFWKLCEMLRDVGNCIGNRNTSLEEIVALFLFTLSHDTKNRRTQLYFRRSGETISRNFNLVLQAILRCHHILFKKPEPVAENCEDERWKWFKEIDGENRSVDEQEVLYDNTNQGNPTSHGIEIEAPPNTTPSTS
ncbi:Toxin YoeB [Bienertia sinuspersici]